VLWRAAAAWERGKVVVSKGLGHVETYGLFKPLLRMGESLRLSATLASNVAKHGLPAHYQTHRNSA
jgi:hypothetical protein